MQLSIVTINYKKPELTIECLTSLYHSYEEQFEKNLFELYIVDNFSQDMSVALLEKEVRTKKYKNVHILPHKENNGFGGGNNFGATKAKGTALLFLNNDTIVGGGIDQMYSFLLDHEEIGVVGGVLTNEDGKPQHSFDTFYDIIHVFLLLLGLQRLQNQELQNPKQVDWVKGACLMIKKEIFDAVHGFDENIFMYTEDMELCYRVKKSGFEVWAFPDVDIRHKDQGSSNRSFAIVHIYQGILYFYQKHRSFVAYGIVKFLLQTKAYILLLLGKLAKNTYLVSTYEKALTVCR